MKRAILTVGLGFGDEGKGATVDFLTRQYRADLVVRYCGGANAGHTVRIGTEICPQVHHLGRRDRHQRQSPPKPSPESARHRPTPPARTVS